MSLEVDLSAAVAANQLPIVVSYIETTSSASTPATGTTQTNNTTAVTALAAPGASTQRLVKYFNLYNADTANATVTVQVNDNSTLRVLWTGPMDPGDQLAYLDGSGFRVLDNRGNIKTMDSMLVPPPSVMPSIGFHAANTSTVTAYASNASYFQYIGKAERAFSQMNVRYEVATAAVGAITWAEIGIFKGLPVLNGAATLTRLGYADVSTQVTATGAYTASVTCSNMRAGDDLWVAAGGQAATTQWQAGGGIADDIQSGVYQEKTTTRISTVADNTAMTLRGTTAVPGWFIVQGRV